MITRKKAVFLAVTGGLVASAGTGIAYGGVDFIQGSGDFTLRALSSLKAAGLVTIFVLIIGLILRAGAIKLVMIPDNMSGVVCRRGRVLKHKTTGEMIWYETGKVRLHVALYRHIVLIHHGERYTELGPRPFTVDGVTWEADFTAVWLIPKEAEKVMLSLTKVSDRNWWDGAFNQLDLAVKEQSIDLLRELLGKVTINPESDLPKIDSSSIEATERLGKRGAEYVKILMSPPYRPGDQLQKDGLRLIAEAVTDQRRS